VIGARRRGRFWCNRSAGAIVAAVAMLTASPAMAAPLHTAAAVRSAPVIDPTAVVQLSDPGVQLTAPVDGRLRGDGSALVVTGAALTNRAGVGGQAVSAGAGRHLIVFAFRQVAPQPSQPSPPQADLALVAAGQRRSIDLAGLSGNGPWNFAAAIPASMTDVDLELSAAGYSQDFNLMTLTRVGPSPTALYRDPDNFEEVDTDNSTVGVAATSGPPAGNSYQLEVGAATTTIGW